MSGDKDTTDARPGWLAERARAGERTRLGLVIAWASAPGRLGDVAFVADDGGDRLLGRGAARADDAYARLAFVRQRPGGDSAAPALDDARISRAQLRVRAQGDVLEIERLGRCALFVNGEAVRFARLGPGDTLFLEDALLCVCVRRPLVLACGLAPRAARHAFGAPDAHGIVGESAAAWTLRERIAFVAGRDEHVLVTGASGTGKELAARAIHAGSRRAAGPFVARNAATLPAGLIDAELFGHAKGYPNAGMAEREGLVGHADGGTLFLDEIGELGPELQAHLLRVLDRGGEYQRLGDAALRRSDLRLIAATNRPESSMKQDLVARLGLRVALPGLDARRDDIALVVRHVLARAAASDARLGAAFFEGWNGSAGEPRIDPLLVERLLRHDYRLHVRELETLLLCALGGSRSFIGVTPELEARLSLVPPAAPAPRELTPERIEAALARHGGSQERAFRELGLSSRDALYRLMKKHGLLKGR